MEGNIEKVKQSFRMWGLGAAVGPNGGVSPQSLVTCGRKGGVERVCTLTESGASGAWGATRTSGRM